MESIWRTEKRLWPKAPREYVFLATAFDEVGRVLFSEWTGNEAICAQQASDDSPELLRRWKVAEWIAERARNGRPRTFGLAVQGGAKPVPLSAGIWNRSDDWELFSTCRIRRALPPRYVETEYQLFLDRADLNRLLEAHGRPVRIATNAPPPPSFRTRGFGGPIRTVASAKAQRIKKPHPSNLEENDAPLVEEMRQLITSGQVSGPNPAALHVADRAVGSRNTESRVRRLEKRYIAKYGK